MRQGRSCLYSDMDTQETNVEEILKGFEGKLLAVIEGFQKEHGLFIERIVYDGYDHCATYTFGGFGNARMTFVERRLKGLH